MAVASLELKELYKHIPEKEVIQNMGIVELMAEQKKAEGIEKVAKAMLIKGLALSDISEFTGLSEEEITKLKSEIDQN